MARKDRFEEQLEQAVLEQLEANGIQEELYKAFKRAEARMNREIQRCIQKYMVDLYYNDYEPKHYQRTWQLNKTVQPWSQLDIIPTGFELDFDYTRYEQNSDGSPGDPLWRNMDHSEYTITMTYITKKGKVREYRYTINAPDDESEEKKEAREHGISNNFLDNIHGFAGKQTGHNIREEIDREISKLVDKKLGKFVDEEIRKVFR